MNKISDLIAEWQDENKAWHYEGSSGVRNLCKLLHVMGYKDERHFGQFDTNGSYGDLIEFLEDNSGCIEAMINWIEEHNCQEWRESLESNLPKKEPKVWKAGDRVFCLSKDDYADVVEVIPPSINSQGSGTDVLIMFNNGTKCWVDAGDLDEAGEE